MIIVVTNNQDFTEEQRNRLDSMGDVTYYDEVPKSAEEYIDRVRGADIICSGTAGLQDAFSELRDVYLTVSFVSVAYLDFELMKNNGVTVSNAPGANRHAVSEWIMSMALEIQRNFSDAVNRSDTYRVGGELPPINPGLTGKKITVLGNGQIGKTVARLANAFDMEVTIFKRGDNLQKSVSNADIVVDVLSSNPSTQGLLNADFFTAMKNGSSFITITREEIVDTNAMIAALNSGKLGRVATDCGGILVGDTEDSFYKLMLKHPRIITTPHISYSSEMSGKCGNDIMLDNVEAWIKGRPQNVLNMSDS